LKSADRAPTCELNPGICLTTEEKVRKNLSQGSRRMSQGSQRMIRVVKEWSG